MAKARKPGRLIEGQEGNHDGVWLCHDCPAAIQSLVDDKVNHFKPPAVLSFDVECRCGAVNTIQTSLE